MPNFESFILGDSLADVITTRSESCNDDQSAGRRKSDGLAPQSAASLQERR